MTVNSKSQVNMQSTCEFAVRIISLHGANTMEQLQRAHPECCRHSEKHQALQLWRRILLKVNHYAFIQPSCASKNLTRRQVPITPEQSSLDARGRYFFKQFLTSSQWVLIQLGNRWPVKLYEWPVATATITSYIVWPEGRKKHFPTVSTLITDDS